MREMSVRTDGLVRKLMIRDYELPFRLKFECPVRIREWFQGSTSFKESKS